MEKLMDNDDFDKKTSKFGAINEEYEEIEEEEET